MRLLEVFEFGDKFTGLQMKSRGVMIYFINTVTQSKHIYNLEVKTNQVYPLHGEHLQRAGCTTQGSLFCFEHPMCVLPELANIMSSNRFIKLRDNPPHFRLLPLYPYR